MKFFLVLILSVSFVHIPLRGESTSLFDDLDLVEKINQKINEQLPLFYNYSLIGGYMNMPSARMAKAGMFALGGGSVPPYQIYGANLQAFSRIELSANYRVYNGQIEKNFGHHGFGNDADRIGNVKFGIVMPEDEYEYFPLVSYGLDDFIGTKRFHSQYIVATKEWMKYDLEVSLGWGKGRIHGIFGGLSWSPWRQTKIPILKNLTLMAEYDAINYKQHAHEHPKGRSVSSRVNAGISYLFKDFLQLQIGSVRGEKIGGSVSIRYPLGDSKGIFPKNLDALFYHSPIDNEPLGVIRPEKVFAQDLAYAFGDQGLDLYALYLISDPEIPRKTLWAKVVNNRYRREAIVKERLENLLASLTPNDIDCLVVAIESEGVVSHQYVFRREDLIRYQEGAIGDQELNILSPMKDHTSLGFCADRTLLFQKEKDVWTWTIRPRLLSFFGSTKGKYKYSIGAIAALEGYLYDNVYYRFQAGYSGWSSMHGLTGSDHLNPSHLLQVRSDTMKYYQSQHVMLEEGYFQKAWNLSHGWFGRLALGYFEPAYAGGAMEWLLYPVKSPFAIGIEGAVVLKRHYHGLGFFHKVSKVEHGIEKKEPFVGLQYFLDFYWNFKPLDLLFKVKLGQFLAKDKGVRVEAVRLFESGVRFSLWVAVTNGHDKVNGRTYFDKGFSIVIPLDFFLRQSSRQFVDYSMSAWLRDVGAISATGKPLFNTLYEERYD